MLQIIYRSNAAGKVDFAEAARIAEFSRVRNNRLSITGAMLFSGKTFVQVIEGGEHVLRLLYKLIEADPRHSDVTLLSRKRITKREFPYSSMRLAQVQPDKFENSIWQPFDNDAGFLHTKALCHAISNEVMNWERPDVA